MFFTKQLKKIFQFIFFKSGLGSHGLTNQRNTWSGEYEVRGKEKVPGEGGFSKSELQIETENPIAIFNPTLPKKEKASSFFLARF